MKVVTTGIVLLMALFAGCSKESATTAAPAAAPPQEAQAPPPPPEPAPSVVPTGASVTVRTTNTLSTKDLKPGDTFSASLDRPLKSGDRIVAPKGATVSGRIVEADPGGRVDGRAKIAVQLSELHVKGKNLRISTNTIRREAKATKAKDAAKVGIGSGIGAAIGAIAGGGKGAAIGAIAGGAAGGGVVVATRGDPAVIAAESVLIFELRGPLRFRNSSERFLPADSGCPEAPASGSQAMIADADVTVCGGAGGLFRRSTGPRHNIVRAQAVACLLTVP